VGEETSRKKRALVVDDEPRIGNILRIKLRLSGYEVITTTSSAEAIELIQMQEPDIVLLDILMHDVSGLDVLSKVRTFSRVPIIVFTAKPDIVNFAMKLGADDLISKPFDPEQVVRKIEAVLNSSQKQ